MEKKEYSKIYRLIHWAIAISFLLILITIFLRLTWLNKSNVADIIQNYLSTTDQSLSQDQLNSLAKQIRQPMWKWHIYIGYAMLGLFSIRLVQPIFGLMKFQSPLIKELSLKDKFQNWMYIAFYVCTLVTLITGVIMELGPQNLEETMEIIHKLSLFYIIPFVVIHLAGILIAEFTNQKGIVSRIINGTINDD